MTNMHTPGPWIPVAVEGGWDGVAEAGNRNSVICALRLNNPANARLIAAAPEMVEALKGLDEAYCRAGDSLSREERAEDRKRLMAARAAIAKATGGAA